MREPRRLDRAERFGWTESNQPKFHTPQQCGSCAHVRSMLHWTCDAFPDGIPGVILTDDFDHRKPYPGDHGIHHQARAGGADE